MCAVVAREHCAAVGERCGEIRCGARHKAWVVVDALEFAGGRIGIDGVEQLKHGA